jgi:hypothetical protein
MRAVAATVFEIDAIRYRVLSVTGIEREISASPALPTARIVLFLISATDMPDNLYFVLIAERRSERESFNCCAPAAA